jgi:hypothetical protein
MLFRPSLAGPTDPGDLPRIRWAIVPTRESRPIHAASRFRSGSSVMLGVPSATSSGS